MTAGVSCDMARCIGAIARIKKVPIGKAVRNAARDFVMGAFYAAPVAVRSRSPYARVTLRNGRVAYLNIARAAGQSARSAAKGRKASARASAMRRLEKHRVRIMKGYSKSTWIGAMKALGMQSRKQSAGVPSAVGWQSTARQAVDSQTLATIDIHDKNLDFKVRTTARQRMIGEGERRAVDKMAAAIQKELDRI